MSKVPYRPLSTLDITADTPPVEPTPTPSPQAPPTPAPEGRRQVAWRASASTHERLRLIAFQQRRSIQDLIDEAVALWLTKRGD